ncbi:Mismatch repair protein msh3 [Ophidiomyces ophidiicola]|nr:Mismatch repair protein msh3 [Ophidiomyces ophidiicola]KAI2008825.1 Mismatch repair protein msh3 [Ophidiomyces ophidiicola]KAI2019965.1 Mismatch repair protein msh3 [Ophidiomyces ophidiicola]KAI2146545.1 Mismatch repair protein msh3 [Ophidiomyces ophidiicola]KAI2220380.1 Mismatch repair protein msh3 [Ophidiomyces ophidiicola]
MSQSSSLKRKQQPTISSFFTRAPSSQAEANKSCTNGFENRKLPRAEEETSTNTVDNCGMTVEDEEDEEAVLLSRKRIKSIQPPKRVVQAADEIATLDNKNRHDSPPSSIPASSRTERFRFLSSQPDAQGGIEKQGTGTDVGTVETTDELKKREDLHKKFVRRLGGPDCLPSLDRGAVIGETVVEGGDSGEEDAADEAPPPPPPTKGRGRKTASTKLTPMEKQVIELKNSHKDAILVVQVGYKFQFYGEDARVAAKELGIVCIPGKLRFDEHPSEAHLTRFASASIPVHRLHVHVKRLVKAGHKVGVVRQIETAALKAAGDNRNAPFERKLTNLYTKGTYVDDTEELEGLNGVGANYAAPATGYLLCITESNAKGWGNDEKVQVGIVAVQPATGNIIYDSFEDGFMRSEIETRLLHIAPCEVLLVGDMSNATDKLVQHLSGSKVNVFGDKARVERVPKQKTAAAESHSHVSSFYAGRMKATGTAQDEKAKKLLDKVLGLPEDVTICLSSMIKHLTEYKLESVFDLTKYFQSFSARSHMLLNGNTLTNLEIYQNQTDYTSKGSLFWTLDRTKTKFGQRLLRKWVGRPLLDKKELEDRVASVTELKDSDLTPRVGRLKTLLSKVKTDLEKNLLRIYYGKCTRPELLAVLQTLQTIGMEFAHVKTSADAGFHSQTINDAIAALPTIFDDVVSYLNKINLHAAKTDDKYSFFQELEETDEITEQKLGIAGVEHELREYLTTAAEILSKKKVNYVANAGIDYLIEVENSPYQIKKVPASWRKISGTKKVSRFHPPDVVRLIRERDQHKEALAAACDKAFLDLLAEISTKYQPFRDCIQALATLDCLVSLAAIAAQPGYVQPTYTDEARISIREGRHPMVEQLLLDAYVPNGTELSTNETRALLVTGPNMGGKSSYVRQVALIAIMGQIGSYVPAESATLGMLDAVYTRMGAFDNMLAGESTFMVELSETSDILKQATPRSLVILDELGRGTSTHDGVAIAQAVLEYIVRELQSLTLFITHYQHLSTLARTFPGGELRNVHMKFTETGSGGQDVTFLYEVGDGVAHRSYGLNVARLANIPPSVLDVAYKKSAELEQKIKRRKLAGILRGILSPPQGKEREAAFMESLANEVEQL